MTNIKKFFILSFKDLDENYMGASEIASLMSPTDEQSLRLPRSFANIMREIEGVDKLNNSANQPIKPTK